jgi:hypothetical protein
LTRRGALGRLAGGLALAVMPRPGLAAELRFQDLYGSFGPLGFQFSKAALELRGRFVDIEGFLAPPLKPLARFVVLCARPVTLCPFCQSDADWPEDIVVVYPKGRSAWAGRATSDSVQVAGVLELGSKVDSDTGFVSQARIVEATVRRG